MSEDSPERGSRTAGEELISVKEAARLVQQRLGVRRSFFFAYIRPRFTERFFPEHATLRRKRKVYRSEVERLINEIIAHPVAVDDEPRRL